MKTREKKRLLALLEQYRKETGSRDAMNLIKELEFGIASPQRPGRKPKYSPETVRIIRTLSARGENVRTISNITGCSVGYVQNLINGHSGMNTPAKDCEEDAG